VHVGLAHRLVGVRIPLAQVELVLVVGEQAIVSFELLRVANSFQELAQSFSAKRRQSTVLAVNFFANPTRLLVSVAVQKRLHVFLMVDYVDHEGD
jgi:hypothetical protein